MRDWSEGFKIVKQRYLDSMVAKGADKSLLTEKGMKFFLGLSDGKCSAWKGGQWPSAEDLDMLAREFGFSYSWLVTGEGDPFGDDAPQIAPLVKDARQDVRADQSVRIAELEAELEALQTKYDALIEETKETYRQLALGKNSVRPYPRVDDTGNSPHAEEGDYIYPKAQEDIAAYGPKPKIPTD
ncbi:MAG: hypothetical protein DELT_00522 [Desulfovibrio sp.]